jgi:hypothetical protein
VQIIQGVSREKLQFEFDVGALVRFVCLEQAVCIHDTEAIDSSVLGEDCIDKLVEDITSFAQEDRFEVREDFEDLILLEQQPDDCFASYCCLHLGDSIDPDVHHCIYWRVEDIEAQVADVFLLFFFVDVDDFFVSCEAEVISSYNSSGC